MCGFAGICLSRPDALPAATVAVLRDSLFHRGPDDAGAYRSPDGHAVLTSRRLAIIDLSPAGHMPLPNEDGTVWAAYNGEVYNFAALRADLERRGHRFVSRTDTEVIAHLYEEYGESCVERLRGMFAFAIWDERKQQLFAARDRFGIKPLYYAVDDVGVSFASEIRALLAAGLVAPEPNWAALAAYLRIGSVPAPHTAVRGVFCLPPGSLMIVRNGEITVRPYWSLVFGGGEQGEARAVQRTRELLEEAVALHLISDAPLGIFLSGGLDSATIAAIATAASPGKIQTLSVAFPEAGYSEAPAARSVAQVLATDHTELEVTADHVTNAVDRFVLAMDQPTIDGMNSYFVSEATRQAGLKVALSGLGGDEVFGGYHSFDAVPALATGIRLARALPGHRWIGDRVGAWPGGARLRRAADAVSAALPSWPAAYVAVRGVLPESAVSRYLRGEAITELSATDPHCLGEYAASWSTAVTSFDRVSALELRGFMANQLLRDTDVFSMAHSIEVRVPLLDHCLVEYVASLPDSIKRGGSKRLLRLAVDGCLPTEILARPKQGFTFPWNPWLMGRLGDEVQSRLREAYPLVEDVLRVDQVDSLWKSFRNGSAPWSHVWSLAMLVLWTARLRSSDARMTTLPNRRRNAVTNEAMARQELKRSA